MSKRIEAFNVCEHCGITYGRPRFPSGKLELMSQFSKRRFCSHQCSVSQTGQERAIPFWDRVDRSAGPDACWPWTGAINKSGYGSYCVAGGAVRTASRVAYELTHGPIPPGPGYHGLVVMHSCDNRPCCNPKHLSLGTQADNNFDRDQKGRLYNCAGIALSTLARAG
jgi:hypothetical protein